MAHDLTPISSGAVHIGMNEVNLALQDLVLDVVEQMKLSRADLALKLKEKGSVHILIWYEADKREAFWQIDTEHPLEE